MTDTLDNSISRRNNYSDAPWEVTFRFARSPNQSGLAIGSIGGIAKRGWEYLWIRYAAQDDAGTGTRIKRPVGVYVERVYDEAFFSELRI